MGLLTWLCVAAGGVCRDGEPVAPIDLLIGPDDAEVRRTPLQRRVTVPAQETLDFAVTAEDRAGLPGIAYKTLKYIGLDAHCSWR